MQGQERRRQMQKHIEGCQGSGSTWRRDQNSESGRNHFLENSETT